jgi:hypothetical protein
MPDLQIQAEQLILDAELVCDDYRSEEDGTLYSVLGFRNEWRMNPFAYLSLPGNYIEGRRYRITLTLQCAAGNDDDAFADEQHRGRDE